jgi:hypothetical protein
VSSGKGSSSSISISRWPSICYENYPTSPNNLVRVRKVRGSVVDIAVIPLINAAFLLLRSFHHLRAFNFTIFAVTPILLRGCLIRARASSSPQRILNICSIAIAKSPGASPDIVEYSRPLFHYPQPRRVRITSTMASSDDDTPLVRAKDQGE